MNNLILHHPTQAYSTTSSLSVRCLCLGSYSTPNPLPSSHSVPIGCFLDLIALLALVTATESEMASPKTAAEQALEKLDEQLTCAICLDEYKDPKLLNCFHVFCTKCLHPLVCRGTQEQTVQCPNCRQPTSLPQNGVPGLQGAFHIHHLFDIRSALKKVTESKESQCDKCGQEKATNFCRNCGQFICQACTKVHQTWKELSSHEIITIQQLTSNATKLVPSKKQAMPCSKHPEKELDLYCEKCEEMICRDCIVRVHRDHQYDLVGDAFPKHKSAITAALEPVEPQLASVNKALQGLNVRCGQITEQHKAIEAEIERSIQQAHEILEARKQELIGQLEQETRQKLKSLAAQQDQFELVGTQLKSCQDFVQESLRTGSEGEILAIKKPMVKQIQEMTSSFKPEALALQEQADVQFSCDHPELNRVCQEFGRVFAHPLLCPEKCHVSSPNMGLAVVGETSTATLQVLDQEGKQCQREVENVNCELVSSDGLSRVVGTVKGKGGNEYELSYRPQHRGTHKLHIRVEGRHVSGSPMTIVVHPKEYTAIRTIEGLKTPWGIAVNDRGEIIVVEFNGHCISIFDVNGVKIKSFGIYGSGPGQLHSPVGVTVDSRTNILVCDQVNDRIQKFSPDGRAIMSVGTHGSGPVQFQYPFGIAVHPHTGKVYVADRLNHRIQILNEDMTYCSSFGSKGSGNGEFNEPHDLAFSSDGSVLVADRYNHRIQVFTQDGVFLRQFGKKGGGDGELSNPMCIAVDAVDTVYIAEYGNKRISLFTKEGKFLKSFKPFDSSPYGVALNKDGLLHVSYADTKCIKVL